MTNRDILLSLAIGLVTFFIGIPVGNWKMPPIQPETRFEQGPADVNADHTDPFVNSDELNLKEIKFVCDDDVLRPFWIDLLKEPRFTYQLLASKLQRSYDCAGMLNLQETDLNADGQKEVVVRVGSLLMCSATANCPVAFYERIDDKRERSPTTAGVPDLGLVKLLYSEGAISFAVERPKHNGYYNIVLRRSAGDYDDYLFEYVFDGRQYRVAKCFGEDKRTLRRYQEGSCR